MRRPALLIASLAAVLFALLPAPAPALAKPRSTLAAGQSLTPGQALVAGGAELTMHRDGDLALYYVPLRAGSPLAKRAQAKPPRPNCRTRRCRFLRPHRLWHSGSGGHPGARLTMRAGGAAVVRAGGRTLWSSHTHRAGASLRLKADGNLVVLAPAQATASTSPAKSGTEDTLEEIWRSGTEVPTYAGSELGPGETLAPGEYLQSPDGLYELDMTSQGRLALWVRGAGPCPMFIAPSGNSGEGDTRQAGSSLWMEASGRLAMRSPAAGTPVVWTWRNYDNPHGDEQPTPVAGSRLVLENEGNLAVLAPDGETVWQTETERIRGPILCPGESLWYGQVLSSPYGGAGSSYQGGYFLQIATANRGRGSEVDVVGACNLCVTHIYRDKTGPSAEGMYLQMQNWGNLELLLDGGDGIPNWETGTTFPNSFAALVGSVLVIFAPIFNSEGERSYYPIYEQPNVSEELTEGLSAAEKISMSMAPMG